MGKEGEEEKKEEKTSGEGSFGTRTGPAPWLQDEIDRQAEHDRTRQAELDRQRQAIATASSPRSHSEEKREAAKGQEPAAEEGEGRVELGAPSSMVATRPDGGLALATGPCIQCLGVFELVSMRASGTRQPIRYKCKRCAVIDTVFPLAAPPVGGGREGRGGREGFLGMRLGGVVWVGSSWGCWAGFEE